MSRVDQERTYNNSVTFSELPIGLNGLQEQAAEQSPMDEWTREILGPYYGLALCSGGLFAWWLRNSLRRKHLLIFVGIGGLAGACFCFLALLFVIGANKVTHPALRSAQPPLGRP